MDVKTLVEKILQECAGHSFRLHSLIVDLPEADGSVGRQIVSALKEQGYQALFQTGLGKPFIRIWR